LDLYIWHFTAATYTVACLVGGELLLYNKSNTTHNENLQTSPLLPHSCLLAVGPVKVSNPC